MRLYVETRGRERSSDYRFLGDGPRESWWGRRYGDRTAFERPTVLVERDARGVRAYLGAIPSSRRDPAGATNRVSVVAEGTDLSPDERRLVLTLVDAWVDDIAHGGRSVADALDEVLDEGTVAELYGGGEERRERAAALVAKAAEEMGTAEATGTSGATPSWIAATRSKQGRAAFGRRVDELLGGRTGAAVLVNLTDAATDFTAEARTGVAVLVHDPEDTLGDGTTEIVAPAEERPTSGKAPTRRQGGSDPAGTRTGRVLVTIAAIVLLVGAVVAVVLGTRSGSTPNPAQDPQPPPTAAVIAPAAPQNTPTTSDRPVSATPVSTPTRSS